MPLTYADFDLCPEKQARPLLSKGLQWMLELETGEERGPLTLRCAARLPFSRWH